MSVDCLPAEDQHCLLRESKSLCDNESLLHVVSETSRPTTVLGRLDPEFVCSNQLQVVFLRRQTQTGCREEQPRQGLAVPEFLEIATDERILAGQVLIDQTGRCQSQQTGFECHLGFVQTSLPLATSSKFIEIVCRPVWPPDRLRQQARRLSFPPWQEQQLEEPIGQLWSAASSSQQQ